MAEALQKTMSESTCEVRADRHGDGISMAANSKVKSDDLADIVKLMKECGLDTNKWIRLISSRYKITTVNQFKHLQTGKQQCATLLAAAENEGEKELLNDFFHRLRTYFKSHNVILSDAKLDSNDPLAVVRILMKDAGLNPKTWLRFMRSKLKITELNQFKQFQKGNSRCGNLLKSHLVEHNWHEDALEDFFESLKNFFNRPGVEVDTSNSKDKTDKLAHIKTFIQDKVKSNFVLHPNLLNMSCQETLLENNFQISHVADKKEISRTIHLFNQDEYHYYDIFKDYIGVECAGEYLEEIADSLSNEIKLRKYSNTAEFSGLVFYRLIPAFEFEINTDELKLSLLATQDLQDFDKNLNNDKTCINKMSHQIIKRFGSHYVRGKMVWGSVFEVIILSQKNESKSFFQKILKEILKYEKSVQQYESKEGFLSARNVLNDIGCKIFEKDDMSLCEISINCKSLALQKIIDSQSPELLDLSSHFIPIWTLLNTVDSLKNHDKLEMCLFDEWKSMISKDSSQNEDYNVVNTITQDEMLESFGLQNWYPGKITLNDVMIITESRRNETIEDIPWIFLQKIIMLDHTARNMELTIPLKSVDIHPLDLLVVVYQCCDPMLQQLLAKKMFLCRMAIPFIVPAKEHLLCCIWPLESITMEWRNKNDEACENAFSVHEMHNISCMRFGRPDFSKSRLLNDLIGDSMHDVFYHCDGPGGMNLKCHSNGVIEISNFLPSRKNSPFPTELAFLNLRGNMNDFVKQAEILCTLSSVVLVIVDFTNLIEAFDCLLKIMNVENKNTIVVLVTAKSIPSETEYENKMTRLPSSIKPYVCIKTGFTFKRQKNVHKIKSEMRKKLADKIEITEKTPCALTSWSMQIQGEGILIDEDIISGCREGQMFAKHLISYTTEEKMSDCKKSLLPLQGKLWNEWSELNKSRYRITRQSDANTSVKQMDKIALKMTQVREKQYELLEKSAFMNEFIQFLYSNRGNTRLFLFALHWLKHYLDGISRKTLPSLQAMYKKTWEEYICCKKESTSTDAENILTVFQKLESDIFKSAFGLEHVLRELSQFYEVSFEHKTTSGSCVDKHSQWDQLPDIAADLLINGVPFEIMDGDAASVPLHWVKAVFERANNKLVNKKVFVLSVIGIQSSGKSTLLNTMFGLEFAVSAGRCTRGIFAQLMPVANGSKLPFEHFLILDSEGLRAPELANEKFQHDNELATFIIGLADLTLVNVKGENTAEMQDVLQIAIHAFLRMKLVDGNKRQRCVFVHQNVSAVNAKDKLIHGQTKLQDDLDCKTRQAALAEEPNPYIRSFSDVIEFDVEHDVWYFSDLWCGDPPMAPINPGYHTNALDLRSSLVQKLIDNKPTCVSFVNLVMRIEDMWKAILSDDFIFSFRNSLAIKAHISLEQHCAELKHSIDGELATWRMPVIQRIRKCESIKKLGETVDTAMYELKKLVTEKCTSAEEDLILFFQNSGEFKEYLIECQQHQIQTMKRAIEHRGQRLESELTCLRLERLDILQQTEEFNNNDMLISEAIKITTTMRGKYTKSDLYREFNKFWYNVVKPNKTTGQTEDTIRSEIKEALIEVFDKSKKLYIEEELKDIDHLGSQNRNSLAGAATDVEITDLKELISCFTMPIQSLFNSSQLENELIDIINGIYGTVDCHLTLMSSGIENFQSLHAKKFAFELYAAFNNYNTQKIEIVLKPRCIGKFCAHAVPFAVKKFYEMYVRYEEKYGYEAEMKDLHARIFNLFQKKVNETSDVCTVTELFCEMIEKELEKTVHNLIVNDIQVKLYEHIGHTKHSFMLKIMSALCMNKCYPEYKRYILNAREYCETWLHKQIIELSFNPTSKCWYHEIAKTSLDHLFVHINHSLNTAFYTANEVSDEMKIKTLVEVFCKKITPHLEFSESEKKIVTSQKVSDMKQCKEMILNRLTEIKESQLKKFQEVNGNNVKWPGKDPCDLVMSELWGCKAQCPFCYEPCQKSEEHVGAHQCIQHRPQSVNGIYWKETSTLAHEHCGYDISTSDVTFLCKGPPCKCGNENTDRKDIFHKYREYKKYHPDWDIAPDPAGEASVYWKWVMCTFNDDIAAAKEAKVKPADLPSDWYKVTQAEAIQSLRKYEK